MPVKKKVVAKKTVAAKKKVVVKKIISVKSKPKTVTAKATKPKRVQTATGWKRMAQKAKVAKKKTK